jgi:hypothetical protein
MTPFRVARCVVACVLLFLSVNYLTQAQTKKPKARRTPGSDFQKENL